MKLVTAGPHVVVGVSDSDAGRAAIRVAAREAATRNCGLYILRVWREVGWMFSMTREHAAQMPAWQKVEHQLVTDAVALAKECQPRLEVCGECVAGDLYSTLRDAAHGAVVIVVGASSDPENPSGIDRWLQQHVTCPVIVATSAERPAGESQPARVTTKDAVSASAGA